MRNTLILWTLLGCLTPTLGLGADPNAAGHNTAAAQLLAKLAPLPEDVPRTIMNPYHADPAWKLWAVDPSPVTLNKPHFKGTFQLPTKQVRKIPVFQLRRGVAELVLEPLGKGTQAGFWDDCYMSLDNHHTRLSQPKDQFIDGGKMPTALDVETILQLGVNFTSQSYADRGRAIVDDIFNNLNTERSFFFANCIRATPAHASYRDVEEDQVTDLYDGLFAHSYQSVGQSGSEVHALYKMMLAGACMPRTTKDLLKKHGAYAVALLTLFKAALPYTDAEGQPLPYEHELRHRPAYSSHGTPEHAHYCSANVHYHGYDDERHLRGMMEMARSLKSPPPVAIAKILTVAAQQDGQWLTDPTRLTQKVKCVSLTNLRLWGEPGETLVVRLDLNQSYDLEKRPLTFKCQALYPNQTHVTIEEEATGIFVIQVTHDPKLPKGRIPVICTASNGLDVPSNPIFVNFYWPGENELDDYYPDHGLSQETRSKIEALGLKRLPVTINKRPVVDFNDVGDAVRCHPGQTVAIGFKALDPEGFPVSVFRRTGEIGSVKQGRFTATIPDTDSHTVYRVHLIFSDGTGGYTGKQIKLLVAKKTDNLPKGWGVTTLGPVQRAANVNAEGMNFTFEKQPLENQVKPLEGTFVFEPVEGAVNLSCQIPKGTSDMALMITKTLDHFSRRAGVGFFQGKLSGVSKHGEQRWSTRTHTSDTKASEAFTYLQLSLHEGIVAGYISTDNQIWEQVFADNIGISKRCYAGLLCKGDPWQNGVCQWLPSSPKLPLLTHTEQPDKEGLYKTPLEIRIDAPNQERGLHYTVDGSEPTTQSPAYAEPIKLTRAGRYEIRVKALPDKQAQGTTVTAVFHLKP